MCIPLDIIIIYQEPIKRDHECGKTRAVLQNIDDQAEYSLLGYANGV
jgi:hypothetical protein